MVSARPSRHCRAASYGAASRNGARARAGARRQAAAVETASVGCDGSATPAAGSSSAVNETSGMPELTRPNIVANATSAASRPVPMRIRPVSGEMPVASNSHQRSPMNASQYEWKSGGPSAGRRRSRHP